MQSITNNGSMGRPTGWGRRPPLIQYLHKMIGEAAEEYYSKIGFPENEASMVRRWLHDLELVNYLENLGTSIIVPVSHESKVREHTLKEKY